MDSDDVRRQQCSGPSFSRSATHNWNHGDYGSSAHALGGLVALDVTARAKGPVTIDGKRYAKHTVQAHRDPNNLFWHARLIGDATLDLGPFDTRDAAVQACEGKLAALLENVLA